jgi:uncharacterized OB-fold protein
MADPHTRPLPPITPDTRPFWDGCAAGELRVQRCTACTEVQFPPRARCIACGAQGLDWRAIAPRGVVYSCTVVHRAPGAAFRDRVPYAIALVDLAPGARLMVNVEHCPPESVAIGMRVRIGFESLGSGEHTVWIPVAHVEG